jgi:hypothetical protein
MRKSEHALGKGNIRNLAKVPSKKIQVKKEREQENSVA